MHTHACMHNMSACVALLSVRSIDRLVSRGHSAPTHRLHCQGSRNEQFYRIHLGILGIEEIKGTVRSGEASY